MTSARVVSSSAGLTALRRRLHDLAQDGQAAVGEALSEVAEAAGADLRAVLPAGLAGSVRIEADGGGCRLTIAAPGARDVEFGTSRTIVSPTLRPIAAAAAERAKPAVRRALREALEKDRP